MHAYLNSFVSHSEIGTRDVGDLLTVVTHNIKNFSLDNEQFVKRLWHLNSCYITIAGGLPDVLVIQEVKTGVDRDPVKQLADFLNLSNCSNLCSDVSGDLGVAGEHAGVIYNQDRLELLRSGEGIPIANKRGRNPKLAMARSYGYTPEELDDPERFVKADSTRLFVRLPAYWHFQCRQTGIEVIVCSVHLVAKVRHTDDELRRLADLLPRKPQEMLEDNKIFILAGDMNFQESGSTVAQTYAVDATRSQGRRKWCFVTDFTPGSTINPTNTHHYFEAERRRVSDMCLYQQIKFNNI